MRYAFLLPVLAFVCVVGSIVAQRDSTAFVDSPAFPPSRGAGAIPVTDIVAYRDPDLDFGVAVPADWTPLIAADATEERDGVLEPGHVVGFEAPRNAIDDLFADYVMIEILPGRESGQFQTDGSRRRDVTIDDVAGFADSLRVDDHRIGDATLDLVVHQAEIRGLGYTVGFYAIGEPSRGALLHDAFELMIRTFHLSASPFDISRRDGASSEYRTRRDVA